jgi:hypothetical protein
MSYVIIDFQSTKEEHIPFNIEIINLISFDEKIYFFGQQSHCDVLKSFFPYTKFIYLKK